MSLAEKILDGDRAAAARLITLIENDADGVELELQAIYSHTGQAHVVGITGPPGGGKSTLVRGLAKEFRRRGRSVGIVAIDPTSPFTGGAILGDRVRMQDLSTDPGIFIRSMASRGALGGLARATSDAVKVLDALGCGVVLVETVGAGQGEVDVVRASHSVVVVEVPGMGDEIQAIKAGILEIADLFAVNKAERVGADQLAQALEMMLQMGSNHHDWMPPVLKTVATTGEGLPELADALERHLLHLDESGELPRRLGRNARRELTEALQHELLARFLEAPGRQRFDDALKAVLERRIDPRSAAKKLVGKQG